MNHLSDVIIFYTIVCRKIFLYIVILFLYAVIHLHIVIYLHIVIPVLRFIFYISRSTFPLTCMSLVTIGVAGDTPPPDTHIPIGPYNVWPLRYCVIVLDVHFKS